MSASPTAPEFEGHSNTNNKCFCSSSEDKYLLGRKILPEAEYWEGASHCLQENIALHIDCKYLSLVRNLSLPLVNVLLTNASQVNVLLTHCECIAYSDPM